MNFHRYISARHATGKPVSVGVIGAGKFTSMFFAQAQRTPGIAVSAVCDIDLARATQNLKRAGYTAAGTKPTSPVDALQQGTVWLNEDAFELIGADGVDVVIDATGDPIAGISHVLAACDAERHIIMVNVEADVLAGPLLAKRAEESGIVYSLAYGDQPALIIELVDWAQMAGFDVVCAGKGTKYLPSYHSSTPDTVWQHYGIAADVAKCAGMNPKMFNSFIDGTKSAIEMAAVANATALLPSENGLSFPPCGRNVLAETLKPTAAGGPLDHKGTVEVISSLHRDGTAVKEDLRWGVYVTFEGSSTYVGECFRDYGLETDSSGQYAALYRPYHLIGLELGISVGSVIFKGEPTGAPRGWYADVVSIAKRDLSEGEVLDGEGGATVWGKLTTAAASCKTDALPIGLAKHVRLRKSISAGGLIRWSDVELDERSPAIAVRREMEKVFDPRLNKI